MKLLFLTNKNGLRLGLVIITIIASSLGCVGPPAALPDRPSASPTPNLTSTVEATASEEITLPSLTATTQPFTATPTIQPTEIHFKPLPDIFSQSTLTPLDIVMEMLGQVDRDRALTDLRRLTGEEPICTSKGCYTITNRETGTEGLQWAKDYVYETLVSLGYSVEVLEWSREGYSDQNVIARKQGMVYPGEEIYFIAHLDGYRLDNPAADDDASGAVSLLELARILSDRYLGRTVVLFFSTGEEHGSLGSHSFVADYPERLATIKYLVSVEMIGYDSNSDGKMEFWSGDQPVDFVNKLSQIITAHQLDLIPEVVTGCT